MLAAVIVLFIATALIFGRLIHAQLIDFLERDPYRLDAELDQDRWDRRREERSL